MSEGRITVCVCACVWVCFDTCLNTFYFSKGENANNSEGKKGTP